MLHTILLELRVDDAHSDGPSGGKPIADALTRSLAGLTVHDTARADAVLGHVRAARAVGSIATIADQVAEAREHHDHADEALDSVRHALKDPVAPHLVAAVEDLALTCRHQQQALDEALSAIANLRAHHDALANTRGGGS